MELTGRCTYEIKESTSKKGTKYTHIVFKIGDYELTRSASGLPFFLTNDQIYILQLQAKKSA